MKKNRCVVLTLIELTEFIEFQINCQGLFFIYLLLHSSCSIILILKQIKKERTMFCLAGFKKQVLNKHHPQTKSLYLLSSCKSYIKTEAKNLANVTALFQENTIN